MRIRSKTCLRHKSLAKSILVFFCFCLSIYCCHRKFVCSCLFNIVGFGLRLLLLWANCLRLIPSRKVEGLIPGMDWKNQLCMTYTELHSAGSTHTHSCAKFIKFLIRLIIDTTLSVVCQCDLNLSHQNYAMLYFWSLWIMVWLNMLWRENSFCVCRA